MSLPIFSFNESVISSGNMSTTITSSVLDISEVTGYCVHSYFTGSPIGTLEVLASNFEDIATFIPVDTYSVTAAGSRILNFEKAQYRYVVVKYTFSSGTGTLTCKISGKRV